MPEHFHALITPVGITIERTGQLIKGGYSYPVKTELQRDYEIWERGFTDHRLRVGEFDGFRRYIDENPVKAGLVKAPEDYPYGSASGKYDLDSPPARLLTTAAKAVPFPEPAEAN
jgi:REP-associated tyrosine transposase